jgi:hypothetical protein
MGKEVLERCADAAQIQAGGLNDICSGRCAALIEARHYVTQPLSGSSTHMRNIIPELAVGTGFFSFA